MLKRFLKPDNMPLVIWISLTQFVSEPLSDQHDTFKKESVKKMYQYFNKPPTSNRHFPTSIMPFPMEEKT